MNILQSLDALRRNNSLEMKTVVLCHLSDSNSNADDFKQRVEQEFIDKKVYVAKKGLDVEL